ncbi:hypothetical protein F4677DRAFT_374565 [Hypoxylon crocopeplum]|nr:hypothetical protein F4677DRAFT_374565 [Hypoxylon crocopeplum]
MESRKISLNLQRSISPDDGHRVQLGPSPPQPEQMAIGGPCRSPSLDQSESQKGASPATRWRVRYASHEPEKGILHLQAYLLTELRSSILDHVGLLSGRLAGLVSESERDDICVLPNWDIHHSTIYAINQPSLRVPEETEKTMPVSLHGGSCPGTVFVLKLHLNFLSISASRFFAANHIYWSTFILDDKCSVNFLFTFAADPRHLLTYEKSLLSRVF